MSEIIEIKVPDIGNFKEIVVIDVLVAPGDAIKPETALITLESDKATMDVPAPQAGIVKKLLVKTGDKVSQDSPILLLEIAETVESASIPPKSAPPEKSTILTSAPLDKADLHAEVLVLGAGPGGYTAAFRAADLGKQVILVERYPNLGGVCLNVGCIPSKALLHIAKVIAETAEISEYGIKFNQPQIDLAKLLAWKQSIVKKLTTGLSGLAKQRKVKIVQGYGKFTSPHTMQVQQGTTTTSISFDAVIIAAGSQTTKIPGFPYDDPRLMTSTEALELSDIPQQLLVIGGGIIGLEMATVYQALGSQITVVELTDSLIPGCDRDLVKPLHKRIEKRYAHIYLNTKVTKIQARDRGLEVFFSGETAPDSAIFDRVLLAVGRRPNGKLLDAEKAGITVNQDGFISVDKQMRTHVPHIFAIGDIVGNPMLAHKATHEGKIAAEVIAGHKVFFDARTIPAVAYTDPEIAWMGITEAEAKSQGIEYEKGSFPWAASGRALSIGREEGITKLLFDRASKRLIGAGIVGIQAGELLAETVLALEMGADVQDIGLTIHSHPTLSETVGFAAELAEGTITDLYAPRKKMW